MHTTERFGTGPAQLVVEVPHGADRRAHYDAVRRRLVGDLPADLHTFFHINTDVGAWQLGRLVAARVAEEAGVGTLAIRCLIPRTFIDCNRLEDAAAEAGLTAGLAPWIRHPDDRAFLLGAHRNYIAAVEAAVAELPDDGLLFLPHTYGPRSMNIPLVDDTIVERLREQVEPANWLSLPLRPEIDFISVTPDGRSLAPPGMVEELVAAYAGIGRTAAIAKTYALHPSTQGARWSEAMPGRALCVEFRRDLLVESWQPFKEMTVRPDEVERLAAPVIAAFTSRLGRR